MRDCYKRYEGSTQQRGYWIVTTLGLDAIPLANTAIRVGPVSTFGGTSNIVETIALPVAIAIVL